MKSIMTRQTDIEHVQAELIATISKYLKSNAYSFVVKKLSTIFVHECVFMCSMHIHVLMAVQQNVPDVCVECLRHCRQIDRGEGCDVLNQCLTPYLQNGTTNSQIETITQIHFTQDARQEAMHQHWSPLSTCASALIPPRLATLTESVTLEPLFLQGPCFKTPSFEFSTAFASEFTEVKLYMYLDSCTWTTQLPEAWQLFKDTVKLLNAESSKADCCTASLIWCQNLKWRCI